MSRKNTDPAERNSRKIRKALRNTPPAYIDLTEYVKLRTRCTTGTARKVLMSGALRVNSHPVGYRVIDKKGTKQLDPYLPATMRDKIVVQWNPEEV